MSSSHLIRLGTRQSKLALTQSGLIAAELKKKCPEIEVTLVPIKTTGDKILDQSLSTIGGKGLFTKEIEEALLSHEIDLAVHSLKDVPTKLPDGLEIACTPARKDPRDALISFAGLKFDELSIGLSIGTSSLRRRCQLMKKRPDLIYPDLRGNVDTRLKKLKEGLYGGIILAAAGLERLGLQNEVTEYLDLIPAVAQGALGLEIRKNDGQTRKFISLLHDEDTFQCVTAERAFLEIMEGGCQVPLGCWAQTRGDQMNLQGFVSSLDGKDFIKREQTVSRTEALQAAREMAKEILNSGGKEILGKIIS